MAIGAVIGLGALTKYMRSPWLWCGVAISVLIFLPNLTWQMLHNFISLDFLKSIHARDIRFGWTDYFLLNQLWKSTNIVTVPLWLGGCITCSLRRAGDGIRLIGWMYLIPLALFFVARGRDYYRATSLPDAFRRRRAGGREMGRDAASDACGCRARNDVAGYGNRGRAYRRDTPAHCASPNSVWWRIADNLQGNFHYEFGWREMTDAVARVRDSLPTRDRARLGVLAADAGEARALNLHGPAYGLPTAISGSNSHWLRGYGDPPPRTRIAVGFLRAEIEPAFESCEWAGHFETPYGIVNDTIRDRTDIFVCRNLRKAWPEFWAKFRWYD